MRHENTNPVVLARKRKSNDESTRSPKVPALQRGIVSWEPPAVDGEDEQSCQAHVAWMQKEWKKKQHNIALVNKRMELTYSFRRQMLNSGKHLLKDVKAKYPFIFVRDQVSPNTLLTITPATKVSYYNNGPIVYRLWYNSL